MQKLINFFDDILNVNSIEYIEKISIKSFKDVEKLPKTKRAIYPTDFAKACGAWQPNFECKNQNSPTPYFLKDTIGKKSARIVAYDGDMSILPLVDLNIGVCPILNINITKKNVKEIIELIKQNNNNRHIQLGLYPKDKVDEIKSLQLENLYSNGMLQGGLISTGLVYTTNGQTKESEPFLSKLNPIFEYLKEKFVRVCFNNNVQWFKVSSIDFEIENFDNFSKNLNKQIKKDELFLQLKSTNVLFSGVPFYPNQYDEKRTLWQNSTIRGFLNGIDVSNNKSGDFEKLRGGCFSHFGGFLKEAFDLNRKPSFEYIVPKDQFEICENAFAGCCHLKKIIIHKNIVCVGENAFKGCNFNFAYREKSTQNLVFCAELPSKNNEIENVIDLKELNKFISNFDFSLVANSQKFDDVINLFYKLKKQKFCLPYEYVKFLSDNNNLAFFNQNSNFLFFKNEIDSLIDKSNKGMFAFLKFANALGCFSSSMIRDDKGIETQVVKAQKTSSFLANVLRKGYINFGEFDEIFLNLPYFKAPDMDFFKFISNQDGKKLYPNLDLILELEKSHHGIFVKAMCNFEKVKALRVVSSKDSKPCFVPWKEVLIKYYNSSKFFGVTNENEDIAEIFGEKGICQEVFDFVCSIRKEKSMQRHILSTKLKEDTILESIEKIKNASKEKLGEAKEIIDELYAKQFTYEMLDKTSPINAIIGLYCDCCAIIKKVKDYGNDIARATMERKDVQNIVVRDYQGTIIAKGAMYVNSQSGYAVINEFEINSKYKKHEKEAGIYSTAQNSEQEKTRDLIFDAFMRGIKAFVNKYNLENEKPIKQVNVGMGFNRLKSQCQRYEKAEKLLKVPEICNFKDTVDEQHVLFEEKDFNL